MVLALIESITQLSAQCFFGGKLLGIHITPHDAHQFSWDVKRKTNWSQAVGSANARQCAGAPQTKQALFPGITSICFVSVLNGMLIVLN